MIDLFKVYMSPEAKNKVGETLDSGFIGQGQKVEEFELALRDWLGNHYVNTLNSATSGLHLALHLCKDQGGERDEVLTTPLTCTATNWPILAHNLKIKWVDVNPDTCNVDLTDLARKITPKTLAIMVVHWGGNACDMDMLEKIQLKAQEMYGYKPPIIEDCAHAWGAFYNGKHVGTTHDNYSVFSFQAIKHLTTGDGGMLVSPDAASHQKAKLLRWYGLDRTTSADFRCEQNVSSWGYKFHMNDINASIGLCNIKNSKLIVEAHKTNGKRLDKELQGISGVNLLKKSPKSDSSYWIYTLRVENRPAFIKHMKARGIATSLVHDRNDKHECVKEYKSMLPYLDVLSKEMICIPCGWWVAEDDISYIVKSIKEGW
jgi:dTDP-4-amino-4,6-dideoxygalactose transaminase